MGKDQDLSNETLTKKPKVDGFRKTSERLLQGPDAHLSHRPSLEWRLDRTGVCEKAAEASLLSVADLKDIITKSTTGAALVEGAGNPTIVFDAQSVQSQFYARGDNRVVALNPNRPKGDLLNTMVRELRRAWQEQQGALINPMGFEPDEAVLVNRAQQADVAMVSVKVAWELKLAGENDAWDFLSTSPMSDVARVFEIHAQKDFRSLNNGEAARVAYDKFFEDSRTKIHDKRLIHQMLLDDAGYMKAPQKNRKVGMDLFARLGEMPQGRNYLTAGDKRAPTDMCYATIEDRSNANFLWFIKFERSFQEKEMQMLNDQQAKPSAEIVDFSRWTTRRASQPGA